MLYPYPQEGESRTYTREISRVFGFLSIMFAIYLPPTGFIMGIIGLVYETKDAKEHGEQYSETEHLAKPLGLHVLSLL